MKANCRWPINLSQFNLLLLEDFMRHEEWKGKRWCRTQAQYPDPPISSNSFILTKRKNIFIANKWLSNKREGGRNPIFKAEICAYRTDHNRLNTWFMFAWTFLRLLVTFQLITSCRCGPQTTRGRCFVFLHDRLEVLSMNAPTCEGVRRYFVYWLFLISPYGHILGNPCFAFSKYYTAKKYLAHYGQHNVKKVFHLFFHILVLSTF